MLSSQSDSTLLESKRNKRPLLHSVSKLRTWLVSDDCARDSLCDALVKLNALATATK